MRHKKGSILERVDRSRRFLTWFCTFLVLLATGCAGPHKGVTVYRDGQAQPVHEGQKDLLPSVITAFRLSPGDVLRIEAQSARQSDQPFRLDTEDVVSISFYYGKGAYRIMPGDEIRVSFVANENINFTTTVRLDGYITIPGVTEVAAAGLPPAQLARAISKAYKNLINDARTTVAVTRTNIAPIESMQGQFTVLPDGKISIPVLGSLQAAGLTPGELARSLSTSIQAKFKNDFQASVVPLQFTPRRLADYDRTAVITPAGEIMLPDVGTITAAGLTMPELQSKVREKIQEKYISAVNASVGLVSSVTRTVYVSGQVRLPGPYPLVQDMTMLKAVMLAGGVTMEGDLNQVVLIHYEGQGGVTIYKSNLAEVIAQATPMQDLRLSPQDVVFVPQSDVAQANQFIDQYITRMLPFTRSITYNFNNEH